MQKLLRIIKTMKRKFKKTRKHFKTLSWDKILP